MDNKEISGYFSLLSKLMDLHGENSFKANSYSNGAYKIDQLTVGLQTLSREKIFQINGIGDAIGNKILELINTGHMKILDEILEKTPQGILEMMKIKGLGSKKIRIIWQELNVEDIGELLYACQENRLTLLKGFGKKTQENVIEAIEFFLNQKGNFLYAEAEPIALQIKNQLAELFSTDQLYLTGDLGRHTETVDKIELVVPASSEEIINALLPNEDFELRQSGDGSLVFHYNKNIDVKIYPSTKEKLIETYFRTINTDEFQEGFTQRFPNLNYRNLSGDEEIFQRAGIAYIPPFLRENKRMVQLAERNEIPILIQPEDIKGIIHSHSNWSDGSNSLEELCNACIEQGYEYLVISDHSKSASYAQGLAEEKIAAQHELIGELNRKLAPFKVFKSIESDILNDGNLDYSNEILATFDLVIASVHSNLKMKEEKAMMRLIKAIENPYTTILGHMTGRLLLSRKGYPVDHKKLIDACAANKVVIEINAHPRRLDMSWKWLEYALEKNVLVSIDPDAHKIEHFAYNRYGVLEAQKGMLSARHNLSSFSLKELEVYLAGLNKA